MRANVNSQRNYEIYFFNTVEDIDKEQILEAFNTQPQWIVDWIRENGNKIMSHATNVHSVIK